MKRFTMIAAAMAMAFAQAAQAQNYLGGASSLSQSAATIYEGCVATLGAQATSESCACLVGYLGATLSDRDYDIAARLMRLGELDAAGAPASVIEAEVAAFLAAGYTQVDAERVAAGIEAVSARGDQVCGVFDPAQTS